jgi:hypothetical protein
MQQKTEFKEKKRKDKKRVGRKKEDLIASGDRKWLSIWILYKMVVALALKFNII